MKKIVYLATVGFAAVVTFGSCRKKVEKTAAVTAVEYNEFIKAGNYDAFVDAIVFEEPGAPAIAPEKKKAANALNAKALKTIHHPSVEEKGGVKETKVVSENVSPDRKTADVVLVNTYNNGDVENIACKMVNDSRVWKIKVNDNKEVWRATDNEGNREVIKLREDHRRDFVKAGDADHRDVVKDIDRDRRDVEKIKLDGNRELHIDKTTPEGEVIKVVENGHEVYAVKTRNNEHKSELKEKIEGEKDFIKVIEKRDGRVEVIKTLKDGRRNREVLKDLEEDNRDIEKLKENGEKIVVKEKAKQTGK